MKYLVIPFFLLFVHTFLIAQPLSSINYSVNEGLPQSQVFAVTQDAKGYMWFGTQGGGLGRFDGKFFQTFLPSTYISAISEDKDKTLWIGTTKGAYRGQIHKFEAIQTIDNQAYNFTTFARTANGDMIVGSEKGLWQFDEKTQKLNRIKLHQDLDKTMVQGFFSDEKGVWISSNRGAFWYKKEGNVQQIAPVAGMAVQAICKDAQGNYWFVTYDKGIFVLNGQNLQLIRQFSHPDFMNATCCLATKDGKVWIGTDNKGIFQVTVRDTTWKNISESDNLPSNHIRQIYQDAWQNIWVCTSGGGVSKLLSQNFIHFNSKNGLINERIYAVVEAKDSTLWCSVGNNGIMQYNGMRFQKPLRDSLLANIKVKSIAIDNSGLLWLGTEGEGIFLMDSFTNRRFSMAEGLPSNNIKSIVADANNHLWAATLYDGIVHIYRKTDNSFAIDNIRKGIPDLIIMTLKMDTDNRLWFGTKSGVLGYLFEGKVVKVFKKENGLPNVAIRAISFDNQGFMYIGTAGEGIFVANLKNANPQFSPLKTNRFYAKNIYLLQFDKQNNLWAGSEHGVEKLVFDAQHNIADIQYFGKNEGFLGIETCQNAAICDISGNMWFGTLNGLTKHLPNSNAQKTRAPIVHFEQISLFYQPLSQTQYGAFADFVNGIKTGLILPYHQNHLGFDFKAVQLNSDAPIQYRWKLQGAETEWSPLSSQQSVNYAKLEAGDYVFMVQATTDGITFSEPIYAPFSISKPFWQMLWFRIIVFIIIVLSIYFFIKYRERKIQHKENILREKLEIQNKMLTLEQKALQLQMNPHFIFNVLTGIQSLVVNQKNEEARQQISNFATLMRHILSNSRKPLISLKDEIETLEGYLQIEQKSQKVDFDYHISTVQDIGNDDIKLPPMLLQPFVENALLHGIARLDKKGKIDIEFSLEDDILYCSISDNGIGREKSATLKGLNPKNHKSAAIDITTERLNTIRKNTQQETLRISDIHDNHKNIVGTKVEVWITVEIF